MVSEYPGDVARARVARAWVSTHPHRNVDSLLQRRDGAKCEHEERRLGVSHGEQPGARGTGTGLTDDGRAGGVW